MKIAIASTGAAANADVSQYGARAPFYLAYLCDGSFQESISNPYVDAEWGAEPKAVRFLAELEAGGIQHVQKTDIATDLITEVLVLI